MTFVNVGKNLTYNPWIDSPRRYRLSYITLRPGLIPYSSIIHVLQGTVTSYGTITEYDEFHFITALEYGLRHSSHFSVDVDHFFNSQLLRNHWSNLSEYLSGVLLGHGISFNRKSTKVKIIVGQNLALVR